MIKKLTHTVLFFGFFVLTSQLQTQAQTNDPSASGLFVSAMKILRKTRGQEDPVERLKKLKQVQGKFDVMITKFPDSSMTVKLITGELRGHWLERVESLIEKTQKEIDLLGNVKFTEQEKACLKDLTPNCVALLLTSTVNRHNLENKEAMIARSLSVFEVINSALKGERASLVATLQTERRVPYQMLRSLLKNGRQDAAVKLMIETGRTRYNDEDYRIDSFAKAMRALSRVTRAVMYRKPNENEPSLNYRIQSGECFSLRRRPIDFTKGIPEDNIWYKLHKSRHSLIDALCNEKDVSGPAQEYFDLYIRPETKKAKQKHISLGSIPNLKRLTNLLIAFGHHETALKLLHQMPGRTIPKNQSDKKKFNAQIYRKYLGGVSLDVLMLKLANLGKKR